MERAGGHGGKGEGRGDSGLRGQEVMEGNGEGKEVVGEGRAGGDGGKGGEGREVIVG